jgi:N-acetylglucosaminyl-diphospho-decaprenol L-rhamnosyltransferase
MLLSVIIVNYNVKYFLEQCLYSVEKAIGAIGGEAGAELGTEAGVGSGGRLRAKSGARPAAEIIVVDNQSSDGSIAYLRPRFPRVQFIVNEENIGFSRANNQALKKAGGDYILFLNPDTVLPEDSLAICISFIKATPGAGALGVRMVDGSGCFLKESRRGFPSPWVAFCKLAGLTALFPHSRLLAKYHLGYLPEHKNHPAPILSGAFLFAGREVLDKTGGFDERFFMYAEDIDLSYRIGQAGYTNYYVADTTILHFKGESTRKDARYVKIFYKAMSQFRRKHFSGVLPGLFNGGVEAAIWLRAGISAMGRSFRTNRDSFRKGPTGADRKIRAGACRSWVTGDAETAEKLMRAFLDWKGPDPNEASGNGGSDDGDLRGIGARTLATDERRADEIIFCEGENFSFREIIGAVQRVGCRQSCKIHAAASSSVAGSHSKDGRGEAFEIKPGGV